MVVANKLFNNFVAGELSPRMYARSDLPEYEKGLSRCQNFMTLIQGGVQYRPGNILVAQTRLNQNAWLIPFQFSDQQSYIIEATPGFFRFYSNGGLLFAGSAIIQGIQPKSAGAIFKSTAHGFTVGQTITLDGIQGGMSVLNGFNYTIATASTNSFTLTYIPSGANVTAKGLGMYSSGGVASLVSPITAVTNANPGVFTSAGHGLTTGQQIFIAGIIGMSRLNGQFFLVNVIGANTFSLTDLQGNVIDTTTYGTYTSGGSWSVVYELVTPYQAVDLPFIQYAQDANDMYLANQGYEPRKMVRNSAASFTINTYSRTGSDPFTAAALWPRAVAFINGSRLAYGDSITFPETLFASDAPSTSATAYNSYTLGALATDAVQFTLSPLAGKSDAIQWISSTNQFGVVGCFGSLRTLYGSSSTQPISPLGVSVLPINQFGCAYVMPITTGESMLYVQRGSRILRSIQYNWQINGYDTTDMTLPADHITVTGIIQIAWQNGIPDCVWCVLGDGNLAGLTFKQKENIAGWHQHRIGGQSVNANNITVNNAVVLSVGIMPRSANTDQLWMCVQRQIGNNVITTIEYQSDVPIYPQIEDYLGLTTGGSPVQNEQGDWKQFYNSVFETQKYACHLDMANLYDGSQAGGGIIAMTPAATTGNGIVITASAAFFTASMIGQELWKQYDLNGNGGGRATIVSITDSTHAVVNIISPFNNTNQWQGGAWLLTANVITGLNYAEGATLQVVCDGGPIPDQVVTNGSITLPANASVVWVGYKYTGILKSLNLEIGGVTGSAEAKPREVAKAAVSYINTAAGTIGTSYYHTNKFDLRKADTPLGRPVPAQSGKKIINMFDAAANMYNPEKGIVVVHNTPMPCCITGLDIFLETVDSQSA